MDVPCLLLHAPLNEKGQGVTAPLIQPLFATNAQLTSPVLLLTLLQGIGHIHRKLRYLFSVSGIMHVCLVYFPYWFAWVQAEG